MHSTKAAGQVIQSYVDLFSAMEDEYMRERAADVKDIGNRLLRNLLGIQEQDIGNLDSDVIIIAHDLTPSDTALMDKRHVKGFATDIGGRTSHTAIMARSLEIPAVLGLCDITLNVSAGDMIILDGDTGKVIVNPDEETLTEYQSKIEKQKYLKMELKKIAKLPSETMDGKHVEIAANIGSPGEVDSVLEYGGDGIGLYRTEFLFMDRDSFPGEEEQLKAYRTVAEKMDGKPVIIRTLDIGGDKKLSYLPMPEEMNPFLGFRAIRLCFEMRELFRTQLRAILRASAYGNILIMYPMISSVEELIEANRILEKTKQELKAEGIPFNEEIKRGVMIEIPSAALTADLIIREADFFSIGTNDLCQYTLAVDRMNEKVSYLYQPFHPGILRLIKNVADASHRAGKFTGMCGEMAGEPAAALLLIGLGLDELSMSAASMLMVKKILRNVQYKDAVRITEHALTLSSAAEIREYCEKSLKELKLTD
jgi:phosphotransferase system enzyme I (PtsI)